MKNDVKPPALSSIAPGGKFGRQYTLFSCLATIACGFAYLNIYMPEKNSNGEDHCFSNYKRWVERKKDEFLGIDSDLDK